MTTKGERENQHVDMNVISTHEERWFITWDDSGISQSYCARQAGEDNRKKNELYRCHTQQAKQTNALAIHWRTSKNDANTSTTPWGLYPVCLGQEINVSDSQKVLVFDYACCWCLSSKSQNEKDANNNNNNRKKKQSKRKWQKILAKETKANK